MIAKACLRQGSFAPGNPGIATTGGRSASAAPQSHFFRVLSRPLAYRQPHCPILDRAYGKAPTPFSTSDTQAFKRAIDMTDDELAAIASGATLHVVK